MSKGRIGKITGGIMYGLTIIAYGYTQIRGIYKICTLCGKFSSNFVGKLESLKSRLKTEVTKVDQRKIDREKAKYDFNEEVKKLHKNINTEL